MMHEGLHHKLVVHPRVSVQPDCVVGSRSFVAFYNCAYTTPPFRAVVDSRLAMKLAYLRVDTASSRAQLAGIAA